MLGLRKRNLRKNNTQTKPPQKSSGGFVLGGH